MTRLLEFPLRDQKAYQTGCLKIVNSSNAILHLGFLWRSAVWGGV